MLLRRQLGLQIAALRKRAGKSHADIEEAEICKRTTISGVENRRGAAPKPMLILELARFFNATPAETDALYALAQGAKTPGWWEEYGTAIPEYLGMYIDLESSASVVAAFEPLVVHGLIQHPDYARALIAANNQLTTEQVEAGLKFRLDRQRNVLKSSHRGRVEIILGESALRMRVGSPAVMEAQREHLLALVADPGLDVHIGVIPAEIGPHAALRGAFHILDFADPLDPPIVYIESLVSAAYLELPEELAECRRVFGSLQSTSVPIEEFSE
jgi:transcriptional regulator with XRE-family HTH domain